MNRHQCIHDIFSDIAVGRPDQAAVVHGPDRITYGELDRLSGRIAHALKQQGIVNGARTAVYLPHGISFMAAILGVLKSGAVYIPLDVNDPVSRTHDILMNLEPDLVITRPEQEAKLIAVHSGKRMLLDNGNEPGNPDGDSVEPGGSRPCQVSETAFIINTSGSTGIPKGIPVTHAALLNLLAAFNTYKEVNDQDRCSLWAGPNFDASVYEIWSTLLAGACLYIPESPVRFDPEKFIAWLAEQAITSAFIPPFMLADLVGSPTHFAIRRLLTGVVPIPAPLLYRIKQKIPGLVLLNGYGPAEALVCATLYEVPDETPEPGNAPVGKPVENLAVFLVGPDGSEVAAGEKGEICIAGIQVSDGYIGVNQRAVEEKFVGNPFSPSLGTGLMYRTGDEGYLLPDGNLMFSGRMDFQIKYKGVRIEPGDIENHILAYPGISQAAVVLKKTPRGKEVLTAYMDKAPDPNDLLEFLSQRLPRYMLPAALIPMPALPQTPQGKIDRRALRNLPDLPDQEAPGELQASDRPETGAEKKVMEIWEQVLGISPISRHANFLLLGGDSISGIRIVSRVNQAYRKQVALKRLFQYPVLKEFAAYVNSAPLDRHSTAPLSPTEQTCLPLVPDQELIWLFEAMNPGTPVYHIPLVYVCEKAPDPDILETALGIMADRHVALNTVFTQEQGRPVQKILPHSPMVARSDSTVAVPLPWDGEGADQRITQWLRDQADTPFDLETGPLFRTVILRGDNGRAVICMTFHHLVFDGWSAGLFTEELNKLYQQLIREEEPGDPETPGLSFFDHISAVLEHGEARWQEAAPFFQGYLANLPPPSLPASDQWQANSCAVEISGDLYTRIKETALAHQTSPFTLLLAFFQLLVSSRTKEADQVTGIAYAGRNRVETEPIIGFLMNTLVVRNRIQVNASFNQFLDQVKKTLDALFQYKDIPFYRISQFCRQMNPGSLDRPGYEPGRDAPLFHALFLMQTMDFPPLDLGDGDTAFVPFQTGAVNADITLELFESQDRAHGHFKLRSDLFSPEETQAFARLFTYLIRNILDDPTESVDNALGMRQFPLSPMQHGMLMETLRAPQGAGAYIEQIVFAIHQELDIDRFTRAWETVIRHHDCLRLGFTWQGLDQPVQFLTPGEPLNMEFNDWSDFSETEKKEYLDMFLQADRRLGFPLSTPPAFRVALFKTHPGRYTCVWSLHHCIADGRTMVYILRDLFLLYKNPGRSLGYAGSFKHYIFWLRQQSDEAARAFWTQKLEGFTTPMLFPFRLTEEGGSQTRRQQHAMTLATGHYITRLSPITARKMRQIANDNQFTLNSFLMGAWAVLLSHYTSRNDILFGATVSVRNFEPDASEKTGLYINTLPVRIQVDPEKPLLDFLAGIRREWQEIRQHQHIALTQIHACSPIRGNQPLSEIFFAYDYQSLDTALTPYKEAVGCAGVRLLERTPAGIFLSVQGRDDLVVSIEYDKRKFSPDTIEQILSHFAVFLKSASEHPHARLMDLPVLTPQENALIAKKLNTLQSHLRPMSCIHHLLEIQTAIHKQAMAVTDGSTTYTYTQLNQKANQVAHYLLRKGAAPEKKAMVLLEQTADTIVVLLGILKSGCCYIPMDHAYPADRIQYIMGDAGPEFIITTRDNLGRIGETGACVVCMDRDMEEIDQMDRANPETGITPDHSAYIIYTSGSTGNPKGVVIEHGALVSFTKSAAEVYDIQPDDVILQFASISFDASAEEIYPTLFSGAGLVIKPQSEVHTPARFFDYCREYGLTVIDLPTSYWHMIADQCDALEIPDTVRLFIIGGDEANPDKVSKWNQHVSPDIRLLNTYGPTETTVAVTYADLSTDPVETARIPIGRPFPDVNLCILNQFDQPAPPGVTGELYIGGPQTARGYLGLEERNRESFPTLHLSGKDIRFFKSGDRAFMLPSGQIIYKGRIDRQIKIRGFRVEPGEIEKTALAHEQVRECAVVVSEDANQNARTIAFIVPAEGVSTAPEAPDRFGLKDFKAWLATRLPDYMLPSAMVIARDLAYTPSGKIDYTALKRQVEEDGISVVEIGRDDAGHDMKKPPREFLDEYETGLKAIWEEILAISDVAPEANFFDVGGSSLIAIRLVTAIEKKFGVSLPVLAVFKFPKLTDLAGLLRQKDASFRFSSVKTVSSRGDKAPVFFIAGTDENTDAFDARDLGGHPFYTVTILAHKTVNNRIIPLDIWEIARKNIREILQASPAGPYIVVGYCRYAVVAYEIATQLTSMGKQVEKLVFLDEYWQKKNSVKPAETREDAGSQTADSKPTGFRRLLGKLIPKTRQKIKSVSQALDQKKESLYTATGRPLPATLQYNRMESAFWKAYDGYMPLPYPGDTLVLDTKSWHPETDSRLRTYIQGDLTRVTVDAEHADWFKPEQIQRVIQLLDTDTENN